MKNSRKIILLLQGGIVTCGGLGFFPKGSGTVASIFACLFWTAIKLFWNSWAVFLGCAITLVVGALLIPFYEKERGVHDSSEVVIDEWLGMGIAIALVPIHFGWIAAAFGLFRLFDIWKPPGVKYFDVNYLKGWGVMLDDLVAGVYALVLLEVTALWINR